MFWLSCFSILCDAFLLSVISSHNSPLLNKQTCPNPFKRDKTYLLMVSLAQYCSKNAVSSYFICYKTVCPN